MKEYKVTLVYTISAYSEGEAQVEVLRNPFINLSEFDCEEIPIAYKNSVEEFQVLDEEIPF